MFIGVNWFLGTAVGSAEQTRDLIYGMRALAPHYEYQVKKPDSDLRTEHESGSAHKSTLGVLNRASIFVNHFAASVSDSTYLVH